MTMVEFNALPLEARRFMQANVNCLACGNTEKKLDNAYEYYLKHKKTMAYQLIGGGVNYTKDGESGVLVAINSEDSPFEIRKKIEIAKAIYKKEPHLFSLFDEKEILEILKSLPKEKVVNLDSKN